MHKSLDFHNIVLGSRELNFSIPEGKKNIIFIDIDGVLQPYSNQFRFSHDMKKTIDLLCQKFQSEIFRESDIHDVCAAYYDWDETAMGYLAKLLRRTGSYLVVSSGWRDFNSLEVLRSFFEFYGLGDYVYDICPPRTVSQHEDGYFVDSKAVAIRTWLKQHQDEVNDFIVIDDMDMSVIFGTRFVATRNVILENDYHYAESLYQPYGKLSVSLREDVYTAGNLYFTYRICPVGEAKAVFFRTYISDHNARYNERYGFLSFLHHFGSPDRAKEYADISAFVWVREDVDVYRNSYQYQSPETYHLPWERKLTDRAEILIKRLPYSSPHRLFIPHESDVLYKIADDLFEEWNS